MNSTEIALMIDEIGTKAFGKHNYHSRPFGRAYLDLVNEIVEGILAAGLEKSIGQNVIDLLTEWNSHTACTAARLVRYAMFDWAE